MGGTALVAAPLLLLAGVLLRARFHFFFPQQLAAYAEHPVLISAAYSCVTAGTILLWPAVLTLVQRIETTRPWLAVWGGSLVMLGLFARTFHAGNDHLAFQLVRSQGVATATEAVAGAYGAFHIVASLNAAVVLGWVVLAAGAYRSGTLGLARSVGLGLMAALMLGVLKGTAPTSIVATGGLCVALVPLGIDVLTEPPRPTLRQHLAWAGLVAVLATVLFLTGQLG